MEVICPNCALKFPIQSGINDAYARRFAAAMGRVPPVMANELIAYLNLFKPKKSALSWTKALKRIEELLPAIEAEQIKYNGRNWYAPATTWTQAINTMLDQQNTLTLPMSNHNYLLKIIAGIADKAEAIQEKKTEQQRQSRVKELTPEQKELKELRSDLIRLEGLQKIQKSEIRAISIETIRERINELTQS